MIWKHKDKETSMIKDHRKILQIQIEVKVNLQDYKLTEEINPKEGKEQG